MTVRLSTGTRNSRVTAITGNIDLGAAAGTVKVYTGAQPASITDAPTGNLLATFTLNDPSFDPPANGSASINLTTELLANAVADGNPGWARFADSDGNSVMDASVGTVGADLTISAASVATGQQISITAMTLTDPA